MQSLAGKRALVTGARGFIGSALVRKLTAAGAQVHAVSRLPVSGQSPVTWHRTDLLDASATRTLLSDVQPQLIFHAAGHPVARRERAEILTSFQGNLVTTVHLLAAADASGPHRLVLAGSLEEPRDGQPPSSPYALSKAAAAAYGDLFFRLYGSPVVHCRIFMAYGPGQPDLKKLIPYTVLSLLRGQRPSLGPGDRLVDWIYVDDVADGLLLAATRPGLEGQSIDLGTGQLTSIRGVAEALVDLTGSAARPEYGAVDPRAHEMVRAAAIEETRRQLAWEPGVSLREGLSRTVAWCRDLLADRGG